MTRDVAILICSRGREALLSQLIDDMERGFGPALGVGGLSHVVAVYAQGYGEAALRLLKERFSGALARGRLLLMEAERDHACIGEVHVAAIGALHSRVDYLLAMLMDDDSRYRPASDVDANLARAAQDFIAAGARAFSIKLGPGRMLAYVPFIDPAGAIMPFKEKMLWVSRPVLDEAIKLPGFASLAVGEDAVIAALAWRKGPDLCRGVFGIGTFLHLGFEPDAEEERPALDGGYAELVGYAEREDGEDPLGKYGRAYRSGVVPQDVLPEIFVGRDHPHHAINGIQPEALALVTAAAAGGRPAAGRPRLRT